jgi:hypothetical protein
MKRLWFVLAALLALGALAPPGLPALSELEIDGGLTLLGNTDADGAPSPLMPTIGVNLPFGVPLDLEVGVLAWGTYYLYAGGRAVPAELEHRDFWVLGLLADARVGYTFRISEAVALGARGGLALLLRVPIPLFDDAAANTGPAMGYLYGSLRFVYPEAELFGRFRLTEALGLRISLRGYFPVFHLWDGEGLPFGDQLMVSALVGVVYTLPGARK